ncbi:hypothetical protein KQX54_019884 [Cotesia glomerata]|uniref:Uncharacterized protein n=1 Tax=Cotesia glomerata TaxID=32391 RepID=A0AAV7J106_COTGL|nr:hypothetical protein KQX54_019884 [Cotesia glomerata]
MTGGGRYSDVRRALLEVRRDTALSARGSGGKSGAGTERVGDSANSLFVGSTKEIEQSEPRLRRFTTEFSLKRGENRTFVHRTSTRTHTSVTQQKACWYTGNASTRIKWKLSIRRRAVGPRGNQIHRSTQLTNCPPPSFPSSYETCPYGDRYVDLKEALEESLESNRPVCKRRKEASRWDRVS